MKGLRESDGRVSSNDRRSLQLDPPAVIVALAADAGVRMPVTHRAAPPVGLTCATAR